MIAARPEEPHIRSLLAGMAQLATALPCPNCLFFAGQPHSRTLALDKCFSQVFNEAAACQVQLQQDGTEAKWRRLEGRWDR